MLQETSPSPIRAFIDGLPKAELHLHIEGTLEPEMIFALAQRNGVKLPYASIEALREAYAFTNLQSFLDLYYAGAAVLITEQDFHDMTAAYLRRAAADKVRHVEIMFDPQTHTERGVAVATVFAGIASAMREARAHDGMSGYLILSFLRHLSEEDAFATLEAALPLREQYADLWLAVGLDSSEVGNPPEKFARIYARCKELGFHLTAHAGEEGPPPYVTGALDTLRVERIDHGIRAEQDPKLLKRLARQRTPLTVCPLSNLKLKTIEKMEDHNLARLLRQGLAVTVNSDDPAYFGGYVNDNYEAVAKALGIDEADCLALARNSITGSFLDTAAQARLLVEIEDYALSRGH
ncbi:MAG: adenosine deaminase [Candidatus Protistobacter heckmanni]|nr:adenosine deaminase [Candidatus Protistobacter heckmanni]